MKPDRRRGRKPLPFASFASFAQDKVPFQKPAREAQAKINPSAATRATARDTHPAASAPPDYGTGGLLHAAFIGCITIGRMRVLIVEDDTKIQTYLKRGLLEQGYAVDAVGDGLDAIDWAVAAAYDLIVLDVLLPRLNGFDVCRELRRRGVTASVLMLTARDGVEDRVIGLDSGADDYLGKPFAMPELLARLRALSRRGDASRDASLRVADLMLDPAARKVQRNGQTIECTAKEFAVLECLMREAGRVLSRAQIAEHVWNFDDANESNVVDVYIRNLRRKIDDGHLHKLIHTIRGAGYKIDADEHSGTL